MENTLFRFYSILILWSFTSSSEAENLYVTPSGAGGRVGTSWDNAFGGLHGVVWGGAAGQLGAGDTLWVSGGHYQFGFSVLGSGTESARLYIKRSRGNNAECTGSVGWQSSFDSQVLITTTAPNICIFQPGFNYITMDGQVTNGIKIAWSHTNNWQYLICRGANLEFKHLELQGHGATAPRIARNTGITPEGQNLLFDHINIHGMTDGVFANNALNVTFQYSTIRNNHGTAWGGHENVFWTTGCRNTHIRYNHFSDWTAVGVLFGGWDTSLNTDGMYIYGNIFDNTGTTGSHTGIEVDCAGGRCQSVNLHIYNNTFVNLSSLAIRNDGRPNASGSGTQGGQVYNNIFFNCTQFTSSMSGFWGLLTHDHNWYYHAFDQNEGSGVPAGIVDPFLGLASRNYQISSAISATLPRNKGKALSPQFSLDKYGNQRGADGFWDMGAYEFGSGQPPVLPIPPSNLRFVVGQ